MLEELKSVLIIAVSLGVILSLFYAQYLILKDRYDYKKKHNVDPWRVVEGEKRV